MNELMFYIFGKFQEKFIVGVNFVQKSYFFFEKVKNTIVHGYLKPLSVIYVKILTFSAKKKIFLKNLHQILTFS